MSKFKSIDKLNKEHFITLRFTDEEYAMIDFKNTLNLKNFYANNILSLVLLKNHDNIIDHLVLKDDKIHNLN